MNNDLNNKKTKQRGIKKDMKNKNKNKPLLSATLDIVFKKLFIENPDLLSSLLESFLPLKSSIENIEIKNPDMTGNLQSQAQKSNSEPQTQKKPLKVAILNLKHRKAILNLKHRKNQLKVAILNLKHRKA